MSDNVYNMLAGFLTIVYNLFILSGTAYLVVHYDWSVFWFIPAFLIMFSTQAFRVPDDDVDYEDENEE